MNVNYKNRTNYFRVTDRKEFDRLMSYLYSEDTIEVFTGNSEDMVGFLCDGSIQAYVDDENNLIILSDDDMDYDCDLDVWLNEFSKIIVPGDACIITTLVWEGYRYIDGECYIITNKGYEYISLSDAAVQKAREILNDPKFTTQMNY